MVEWPVLNFFSQIPFLINYLLKNKLLIFNYKNKINKQIVEIRPFLRRNAYYTNLLAKSER